MSIPTWYTDPKNETIPVVFRRWPKREGGGVIALFPTLAGNSDHGQTCSSYESVGQHGSADAQLALHTRVARLDDPDVIALKRELESPPYEYKFRVYDRMHPWFREARLAELRESRSSMEADVLIADAIRRLEENEPPDARTAALILLRAARRKLVEL